jgi:peptidoglycan hydrolase-like protein with peptidoglycan-binding domain
VDLTNQLTTTPVMSAAGTAMIATQIKNDTAGPTAEGTCEAAASEANPNVRTAQIHLARLGIYA